MSFTDEEVNRLKRSPYILKVSKHQISYGSLFFQEFWRMTQEGYSSKEAFDFLGLDPEIAGEDRIHQVARRAKKMADKGELYEEDVDGTLSIAELIKQKDSEIERLRQENKFLKKKKHIKQSYKT